MTKLAMHLLVCAAAITLASCERPPPFNAGVPCSLNTDCAEPLVCGLERCRRQCVDSRDCAAGLLCLQLGGGDGVCQLPDEADCVLTSDCSDGLVCRFGTCTTACADNRDCPPGSSCEPDPDEDGALACIEDAELCVFHSDCEARGMICGPDQRCRFECIESRDCDPLRQCIDHRCYPADAGL